MLLISVQKIPSLKKDKHLVKIIKNSCDFMLSLQFESGNFPSSIGKDKDDLVHFCHGAPGCIPFLLTAFSVYDDKTFIDAALKAGNAIWERGLVLKGNGICHGITGNAFALLLIYKAT
jgi:hypothetical protein